ncbi:hypothetical protein ACTFIW_000660 [Dictyostelium discoideum]
MIGKLILLLTILGSFYFTVYSVDSPYVYDIKYINGTLVYVYFKDESYFTRFILYQNRKTPRSDMAPNYFNCTQDDEYRYCVFHSDDPLSRLWGSVDSMGCVRDAYDPKEDCSPFYLRDGKFPQATQVKYRGHPPTSGGDIVISGNFLRFLSDDIFFEFKSVYKKLTVKGNFPDPSFNCNNITVTIPPSYGKITLFYDDLGIGRSFLSYAQPTISINHKKIQVNNYKRADPGPMYVNIKVDKIEMNYTHCFPAKIASITSVTNQLGGIVTIQGSMLSSTSNSSLVIPTITIGDKQCTFIKSTTTQLECKLDPNESGGKKLVVNVNFNGCNSTSSNGGVTFSYNIPTLLNGSYSNGFDTLNGKNLVNYTESFIQIYGYGISNGNIKIYQSNTSNDGNSLSFKLPLLRCDLFNINFTNDGFSSNTISISSLISINVINRPSVSNGTLKIEFYYISCQYGLSSAPSILFGNSSFLKKCSIPSLQSPTSDYYQITCPTPNGTGINRHFQLVSNSMFVNDKFSYSPPKVELLIQTSLIQIYFNGIDISSRIQSLNDNEFTFERLNSYENGPINITVDGTNLLTNDKEFKVKVTSNNQNTTIIKHDEKILIVKADSNDSSLIISVFIGNNLMLSNVALTYLKPIITVIPIIQNKKDVISIIIGGISLSEIINASLTLSSNDDNYNNNNNNITIHIKCNLQFSQSPNETFYNENSTISSNENDISSNTDRLSCHSNSISNVTTGLLNLHFSSTLFQYDVKIEGIESSSSSSSLPSLPILSPSPS